MENHRMGPPVDSVQLPKKWPNSIVYGRYNELVNGDYFMAYKPTYNWGAPSCRNMIKNEEENFQWESLGMGCALTVHDDDDDDDDNGG